MGRLKREVAVKRNRAETRFKRPKIKGVYLRCAEGDTEVYDVSVVQDGKRASKRLTIAKTTSSAEFVKQVEDLQKTILEDLEVQARPDFPALVDRYCAERGLRPSTTLSVKRSLMECSLDEKKNRQVVEKILISPWAEGTKRVRLKAIRAVFTWLQKSVGLKIAQPCDGVKVPRGGVRQRIPTQDELDRLVEYIDHIGTPTDRLFLRLLIATGARCSTISALRVGDMSAEWKISLYNVKIGRRYAVKLHIADETTRTLWASVTDGMVTGERIFQDTDGERLRKRMIRLFPADAFGETLSPHSLRHLKATTLANQGIPVKTAAAILDCTPAVLVSVYTTVQQDDVDRAMGYLSV